MSPVACWELIGNHCVIRCDCAPPLPPEDAGRVYGPEFWLLTAQRSSAIITRTVHNRALASDFFLLISFFFFFFFLAPFLPPLKNTLLLWQHEGTRSFGIISSMDRFKCTFPRSCSWAFVQGWLDSRSVMDINEFAVLKLFVVGVLSEYLIDCFYLTIIEISPSSCLSCNRNCFT